jgi:hypothetical protein
MQDQKNNLSIFNFKKEHISLLKQALLFFLPVIFVFCLIEILTLQIPFNYKNTAAYLNNQGGDIELASFGSSQMRNAVNPKFIDIPSINFGSTSQHHRIDFEVLKQTKERLPKLKTVIFEVSYSHFEFPHNSKEFWKNSVYLKYFDVNAFDRMTYFKDKLIFTSRPDFYIKELINKYITKKNISIYNKYGYQINDTMGAFSQVKFNLNMIRERKVDIKLKENSILFKHNTHYFENMIKYAKQENLTVIIATLPMYETYLKARNTSILHRRDSVIDYLQKKYNNVLVYRKEEDTSSFKVYDYNNENHLNSFGGEKYSKALNVYLKKAITN